jgi:hypothetical protein
MPCLTLGPADQHGFSSLNDCQSVSQEILCVLILLYIYLHIQCLSETVVNYYVIHFIILVLPKFSVSLFAANHLPTRDTTLFDNIQKSFKFLPEIMMLMSSANITGAARVFIVGGRSFI